MKTLLWKTEIIRNWCRCYEEILASFFEIISVKLVKNYEILEKLLKNTGHTSHKLRKNILMGKPFKIFKATFGRT